MFVFTFHEKKGDSGGAFQVLSRDSKTWKIQGIVSLSPRKHSTFYCDPFKFTIFTRIDVYLKWIRDTLNDIEAKRQEEEISLNYEPVL